MSSNLWCFPEKVILLAAVFCLCCFCTGNQADFYLVSEGEYPYAIVLSDEASPSEEFAAKELQQHIKLATGYEIPIVDEASQRAQEPARLLIGRGGLSEKLVSEGTAVDWNDFGDEDFIIRTVKGNGPYPDIVIAGGRLRGTMYGVFTFLDKLGFRWYTNRKTWLPQDRRLPIPYFNENVTPLFMYRCALITEARDPDWAVRNRIHAGLDSDLDDAHGHSVRIRGVHTLHEFIPDSLYRENPEYFPMIGGRRVTGAVQRCLSNPEVVEVAAKNMIALMKRRPNTHIFALTQEDVEKYCECPECTKIAEAEGSQAGVYVDFANKVAEITEKIFPENYILTYAYWFTEKPPKTIKPHKNVLIQMSAISICCAHPFPECSDSASVNYYERLQGWSKLTDRIFIWHYATNFRNLLMPFPDFKEFAPDVRNYYSLGVRGLFFQSSHFGPGGSDSDLRAWVMARLLWDFDQDPDELVNEWMHAVYGPAFEPMREYHDLIHSRVADPDQHLHIFENVTRNKWPDDVVNSMDQLHEKALSIAEGDTTAMYYIGKSRAAVKFLKFILNAGTMQVVDSKYQPVGNKVTLKDYNDFMEYAGQFGIVNLSENSSDSELIHRLRQRVETYPVVTLENDAIKLDIVPGLGGRIVSLINKETGTNLISNLDPTEGYYPVTGGYEESNTRTWRCTGFSNVYKADKNGRQVTLTAIASHGLVFKRTISLPEHGPKFTISSSLINKSERKTNQQIVCRMYLNSSSPNLSVKVRKPDGSFGIPVTALERGTQYNVNYRYDGANKPSGAWRLENLISNRSMENRFNEEDIEVCMITREKSPNAVRMEIRTPVQELEPGEKISFTHSWEIK